MPSPDEVASRAKERFPFADVKVVETPKGYRIAIAEPGHRTLVMPEIAPEMIDTGIHLLAIWRKDAERTA